jgi:hypothetical protein
MRNYTFVLMEPSCINMVRAAMAGSKGRFSGKELDQQQAALLL